MDPSVIKVDSRWTGNYGIARYAREVISRLDVDYELVGQGDRHGSLGNAARVVLSRAAARKGTLYSPGYDPMGICAVELLTIHDLIHLSEACSAKSLLKRQYYEFVVKPTIVSSGAVITVSEFSAMAIERWIDAKNVSIVNCGNGCSDAFTQSRRIESPGDYVVFVGNGKAHKNPEMVFQALSKIPALRLAVVSSDLISLQRMAGRYDLGGRIEWHRNLSDEHLAALYSRAVATLVPSSIEGFGLPAAESLACGTPVVYWKGCTAVAEIVGDLGVAVSHEDLSDPEAWKEGILSAVRCEVSEKSRRSIGQRYSWDSVATRVNRLLEDLV